MKKLSQIVFINLALLLVACSSMKTPSTANVAVSQAAVESASQAGAVEFAPAEMQSARDKIAQANQALQSKDYKLANDLAASAEADAKLAQAKVNSGKAQAAADALQEDLRVLQSELARPHP